MEAHWIDSIGEVLLPRLQELGLHVDARTQLTVRQWLRTLEARATLPTDPAGLGHALRSIVCKTPRELALFDAQFDTWREPYTAGMTDQAAVPPARSWIEQAHDRVRSNRVAAAGQTRGRRRRPRRLPVRPAVGGVSGDRDRPSLPGRERFSH